MTSGFVDRLTRRFGAVGDTTIYLGTVVVGQVASLLFLPLVTRFLPPAAFGEYALVLAITGLLGILGSVWVRNVGMRLFFDYVADGRTRTFFVTAACVQASAMTVVLLLGYFVAAAFTGPLSPALYAWAGCSVVVADFYSLAATVLRAAQRAFAFGAAETASAFLRLSITAAALVAGLTSPAALFACAAAALAIAAAVAMRGLRGVLTGPIGFDSRIMRELVRLGFPSIPQSISSWVMVLSDRLLLAHFLDVTVVGLYSAAYSVADRAVSGLVSALFMGAWPAIMHAWTADRATTPQTISRYFAGYVLLSVGPCVLLGVQAAFVLRVLMSPEYMPAAGVIPWVVAGAWLSGVATYLSRPLELNKRYGWMSAAAGVAALFNILLNLLLIPSYGLIGAAVGTTGAFALWAVLSRLLSQRFTHVPIPWSALACASVAAAAAAAISSMVPSPVAAIAAFLVVYGGVLGLFWMWKASMLLPGILGPVIPPIDAERL